MQSFLFDYSKHRKILNEIFRLFKMEKYRNLKWPGGASFAFTVFDDTDSQSLERGKPVYEILNKLGFKTTKSVWIEKSDGQKDIGGTCDDENYLLWIKELQKQGFEIAWHMARSTTSKRGKTIKCLEKYRSLFGQYPECMANHYECLENIYFGDARVSGFNRLLYNLLTKNRNKNVFKGHVEGDALFWGDHCREKINYVRNFVYGDINTLKQCPMMPYHDSQRPFVNKWFAASEGANVLTFNSLLSKKNIDRLEMEKGACIVYTHFGLGFYEEKESKLNNNFVKALSYIKGKDVWLPTVSELLHYLEDYNGVKNLAAHERFFHEIKWIFHKIKFGSA